MRAKRIRLYFREARTDAKGRVTHPATYVIRDGARMISCQTADLATAERKLAEHSAAKQSVEPNKPASRVYVADCLAKYLRDLAPSHSRPKATALLVKPLLDFFSRYTLADVTGDLCRRYAAGRSTDSLARRELECLKSALRHAHREGIVREHVGVWLPPRRPSRDRWLTPQEAAQLVRHCWHYRETKNGEPTTRATRKHVAKFVIVALRTGRRAGVVVGAKLGKSADSIHVDLDTGMLMPKPNTAKTKKRQPAIPLPGRLLAHLRRWRRMGQRWVIEYNGKPVTRMGVAFRDAVRDAGLDASVTPHTLRHSAATWLMQSGADAWAVAGYLGMSVKTLEAVYGHHHPAHLAELIDVLNRPGGTPVAATGHSERPGNDVARDASK